MKRIALVTGGIAGIGAAIAAGLRQAGNEVVVVDVAAAKVEAFRQSTGLPAYVCDVSNFADVERVLGEIQAEHGPIDILVNNAGITRDGFVHKMDPVTQWQAVIDVNLTSVFNTVRVLAPGLRERQWGRIINISSMNGQKGQFGQANYSAAKAGMIGFTKAIAQELAGKHVTANCIAPGFILTDMTQAMRPDILEAEAAKIPAGRMGLPADIAATAVFLASDGGEFITGQVLAVNGGQYM